MGEDRTESEVAQLPAEAAGGCAGAARGTGEGACATGEAEVAGPASGTMARSGWGRRALAGLWGQLVGLRLAVALLSRIPVGGSMPGDGLGIAAPWFGVVGAALGLAEGGVRLAAGPVFGRTVAAVFAVAVAVALTGALHQDGLADCADALGVRAASRTTVGASATVGPSSQANGEAERRELRRRRLAVMREPGLGTYGTLALVLWALASVTLVAALPGRRVLAALAIAAALGRWAAVLHGCVLKPARSDGLGAAFSPGLGATLSATVLATAVSTVWLPAGPLSALAALAVCGLVVAWARRALGGRTGDTLGATALLAELGSLGVLVALAR